MTITWSLLECTGGDFQLFERKINEHDLFYKIYAEGVTIFSKENVPSKEVIKQIESEYINSLSEQGVDVDDLMNDILILGEASEIMFDLTIPNWISNYDTFIDFLQKHGVVDTHDEESWYFKEYEYAKYSKNPLFHNIRKERIAVYKPDDVGEFGLVIIGFMLIGDELKITLKTFNYDALKTVIGLFTDEFTVIFEGNLAWQHLMSRFCSSNDYRPTESHLVSLPISYQYLKTSASSESAENFLFVYDKLLDRGYLKEEEYQKVAGDKDVVKFLFPYWHVDVQGLSHLWVRSSTGQIYVPLTQGDPRKISSMNCKIIYAPQPDLLHYINAFWHQNFVEAALTKVKQDWEKEQNVLRVLDLEFDIKFDLRSLSSLGNPSRDFDALMRVKCMKSSNEYIIPVEMKPRTSYYPEVKKENVEKIEYAYASIFSGFLMVACIDSGTLLEPTNLEWGGDQGIRRPIIPCVEHKYKSLVESLKSSIAKICI